MTTTNETQPSKKSHSSSNVILWLLTWIAIIAIASYTVWQKENTDHTESAHMKSIVDTMQSQEQVLKTLSEIVQTHDGQFTQVAQHSNELVASVKALNQQLNQDDRIWRIMQVQTYIEQADLQAGVMHDSATAAKLLNAAEKQLQQLADPKLSAVSNAIKKDLQALQDSMPIDKTSLITAINAFIAEVPNLPLKSNGTDTQTSDTADAEKNNWQEEIKSSWQEVKSLVQIRKGGEFLAPHISADQVYLINENLQLMLQQANFAALKGEQALYVQQLKMAATWLNKYYDVSNSAVAGGISFLEKLQAQRISSDALQQFYSVDAWQQYLKAAQASEAP